MQHEKLNISNNFSGYLLRASVPDAPALILIHEIFGVNAYMRDLAAQYARRGYTVLVPDLFWRTEAGIQLDASIAVDRERAMQLNSVFNDDDGMADLKQAIQVLKATVGPETAIGAVGYCLGGRMAFKLATQGQVDAAVSYYGVNIDKFLPGEQRHLGKPLLIHIAGDDHLCGVDAQGAIAAEYRDVPFVDVIVHDGAGHGFSRPHSQHHSEEASARAQKLTDEFLQTYLKPHITAE